MERVDDADHGAKQSDERCRRSNRRERRDALLQIRGGQRGRALNGPPHGVHEIFTVQPAAALLLKLVFLQACEDDLGEMAVPVVLGGGDADGVLEASFLQVLGHLRCEQLRLASRLVVRVDALDCDAD